MARLSVPSAQRTRSACGALQGCRGASTTAFACPEPEQRRWPGALQAQNTRGSQHDGHRSGFQARVFHEGGEP